MITDAEAKRIASEWHGGGGTALYALASTGAIDTARWDHRLEFDIISECRRVVRSGKTEDAKELYSLWEYVAVNGPRGPVDGWSGK